MPTIKQSLQLIQNMGLRYTIYRIGLELEKRTGLFKRKFPQNPVRRTFINLNDWRKLNNFWGIQQGEKYRPKQPSKLPDFSAYMEGKFTFFSANIFEVGKDYDWITNPDTGHRYDSNLHWTMIQDYSPEAGDIKFVWEKSRFSYLYDVIRHDVHTGEDHAKWVFDEIGSWLKANPVNSGPNYKCSQEISLRILNWTYALNFYKRSPFLTESFFQDVMHSVYWQLKHVYENINFSRILVRNNHAITETLTLYLSGFFFPFFPESKKWKSSGKKWFEQEIAYQIYPDGTFLQFSMNYHRVVIQLLTWALKTADYYGDSFERVVYLRAYKSLCFLHACQDTTSGKLPNYGSNDGALFFKLNACDYRDYRPQLNALHVLLTGENLYDLDGDWEEDIFWFKAIKIKSHHFSRIVQSKGWNNFPVGGYYILRESDSMTFIRCGNHSDRPAQADNLHIDIWYKGENVLYDGGSYKYNTDKSLLKYFMGTESHNTVMLGHHDQMLKGQRFIWYNWSQCLSAVTEDTAADYRFSGEISAFKFLNSNISHKRSIRKRKGEPVWIVEDSILNKPSNIKMKQYWHLSPDMEIANREELIVESANLKSEQGYRSDYYGLKEIVDQIVLESDKNSIKTILVIK